MMSDDFLDRVKLYCKIDYDFEDELLELLIEGVKEQLCAAIAHDLSSDDFDGDVRFELAVLKQVKEEYEHRGLSADSERYPLANGVLNLIHQLRLRGDDGDHT